ncbi:uncharacterized protein NPIL_513111 [Nephila pilipes]|uniref:Uncharacterized protein n=1 Tax=Nephila pilipes TaxID=299642 RepID=A0A8X6MRJ7_NEPPI|nr:uncharacterized protein NPIL_513111 [Nephila pilipes]
MLADKLEAFDKIRLSLASGPRRHVKAGESLNDGNQITYKTPECLSKSEHSHVIPNEKPLFKCYECGIPGLIKSRSPTSNPNSSRRTDVATNHVKAYAAETRNPRLTLISLRRYPATSEHLLKEGQGESLTFVQKEKLKFLLESYKNIFEPEGETTSILDHQDTKKFYTDKKRKAAPKYKPGEHVFMASHPLSNT